ncbi:unnamed protein product, partial [Heterosigma akashiwo]
AARGGRGGAPGRHGPGQHHGVRGRPGQHGRERGPPARALRALRRDHPREDPARAGHRLCELPAPRARRGRDGPDAGRRRRRLPHPTLLGAQPDPQQPLRRRQRRLRRLPAAAGLRRRRRRRLPPARPPPPPR